LLGNCGRNFAAGMSGGIAYVLDQRGDFREKRCNCASVDLEPLADPADIQLVHDLVARHCELTGSRRARCLLDNWLDVLPRFVKVFPHEYKRVLGISRKKPSAIDSENIAGKSLPLIVAAQPLQPGQVHHG